MKHTNKTKRLIVNLTMIAFIFVVAAWSSAALAQNAPAPPPTYTVDRTDDATVSICAATANDCTLRGAIAAANARAGSTVNFDATLFATAQTINLPNGQLNIGASMTITGTTADKLRIRNTKADSRVFLINPGTTVNLSGMTITGGNLSSGGGGGGILNNGTITITNCVIDGNTSGTSAGGGIANASTGSLTLLGSTVSNNTTSSGGFGSGGIDSGGTLIITNSTVSGNKNTGTSPGNGGGIIAFGTTTTITNSTITNNSVGGSIGASGIAAFGTVTLKNTIVAGNVNNAAQPDLLGNFTSSGNNLIGNPGGASGSLVASDLQGDSTTPLDPKLSPLGNYGGGTLSHALLLAGTSSQSPTPSRSTRTLKDFCCKLK